MGEAFRLVRGRLKKELQSASYYGTPTIFILSDGDPTDATPEEIIEIADEVKGMATIVSCFVTDADLTERRRLYGAEHPRWSAGAELMFRCASPVPQNSSFSQYLYEYNWRVDDDARLFAQVNQSEMLSEFMNMILSPLRDASSPPRETGRVRVFVSYSRGGGDAPYKTELLDFLKRLSHDGFEFWTDEDIPTGRAWDEEIRAHLAKSDIVLALVNQSFLGSDYIQNVEVASFLERRSRDGMLVYPVIMSPCAWRNEGWLAGTQSRPRDGRTVSGDYDRRPDREKLYLEIHDELLEIGRRLRG